MPTTKPDLTGLALDELGRVILHDEVLDEIEKCSTTLSAGGYNGWCYQSTNGYCKNGECGGSTNGSHCTNESYCGGATNHRFCIDGPI